MPKVIHVCFGFVLVHFVIGLKNSRRSLNQSGVKPKPIVTSSHTFSCALHWLNVFASSFDWFTGLFVSFVVGQTDYFSFGLRHSIKNCPNILNANQSHCHLHVVQYMKHDSLSYFS